jgi:hypothetical protein
MCIHNTHDDYGGAKRIFFLQIALDYRERTICMPYCCWWWGPNLIYSAAHTARCQQTHTTLVGSFRCLWLFLSLASSPTIFSIPSLMLFLSPNIFWDLQTNLKAKSVSIKVEYLYRQSVAKQMGRQQQQQLNKRRRGSVAHTPAS